MLYNDIRECIQEAVAQLLSIGDWRRYEGKHTQALAEQLSPVMGQRFVQLASSGTAALEIILRGAGIKAGDEVLLSAYDYPGNFWAIERAGARPVLIDTLPACWSLDQTVLSAAYQPTCKALVASHLHGELQSLSSLRAWCDEHQMLLIEDACQAIGAKHVGSRAPAGSLGHAAIISFGGGKVLSCGRGGAWGTSNDLLAQRARIAAGAGSGPYGLSEIQAAIVLAQLPWLDAINRRCHEYFRAVNVQLASAKCIWKCASGVAPDSDSSTSGFYQAGWLLPSVYAGRAEPGDQSPVLELVKCLRNSVHQDLDFSSPTSQTEVDTNIPFGIGFPGFHRRSSRRCRLSNSLTNAAIAAERTVVLHHSVALAERFSAEHIASRIMACDAFITATPKAATAAKDFN